MYVCTLGLSVIVKALYYKINSTWWSCVSESNSKLCFKSFTRTISLELHCLENKLTKVWFHKSKFWWHWCWRNHQNLKESYSANYKHSSRKYPCIALFCLSFAKRWMFHAKNCIIRFYIWNTFEINFMNRMCNLKVTMVTLSCIFQLL